MSNRSTVRIKDLRYPQILLFDFNCCQTKDDLKKDGCVRVLSGGLHQEGTICVDQGCMGLRYYKTAYAPSSEDISCAEVTSRARARHGREGVTRGSRGREEGVSFVRKCASETDGSGRLPLIRLAISPIRPVSSSGWSKVDMFHSSTVLEVLTDGTSNWSISVCHWNFQRRE